MIRTSALTGATATIRTGKCVLRGILMVADTGTEPILTVYNNTAAAGTDIKAFLMPSDEQHTVFVWFGEGLSCSLGIHAVLSAATADYIVYYEIK